MVAFKYNMWLETVKLKRFTGQRTIPQQFLVNDKPNNEDAPTVVKLSAGPIQGRRLYGGPCYIFFPFLFCY